MVQHLFVPVDESLASWRAFETACALAQRVGCDVHIVHIADDPADGRWANDRIHDELEARGPFDVDVTVDVRLGIDSVASEIETAISLHPGAVVVMSSHGKGRSAAVVGRVTEDMLHRTFGPIVLIGPHVEQGDFSGPLLMTVDGSLESEAALPLAATWAIELHTTPWVVNVTERNDVPSNSVDVVDSMYPARLAKSLAETSGHAVEFEVLHGSDPARAVPEYAAHHGASLIVAASHRRSGLERLVMGSVTAGFVRHATCPIVLVGLPHSQSARTDRKVRQWAY